MYLLLLVNVAFFGYQMHLRNNAPPGPMLESAPAAAAVQAKQLPLLRETDPATLKSREPTSNPESEDAAEASIDSTGDSTPQQ